jgi:hypothetical protein
MVLQYSENEVRVQYGEFTDYATFLKTVYTQGNIRGT